MDGKGGAPRQVAALGGKVVRSLLRTRLFYKILIANAVICALGVLITARTVSASAEGLNAELVTIHVLIAALTAVAINAVILDIALRPLEQMAAVAIEVHQGDRNARMPPSRLADEDFSRLTRLFNRMLDDLSLQQHRLEQLAARALTAQEDERSRISRDLHDDTAQRLAALLLRLRLVERTPDSSERDLQIGEMRVALTDTIEEVRRVARGLHPPALHELGLAAAIERHVAEIDERSEIAFHLDLAPLSGRPRGRQADLALYRIAQEAIDNARRHSGAGEIRVRVVPDEDRLALEVEDDGHGFDISAAMEGGGSLGLLGMMERAANHGGHVEIQRRPGGGTIVRATMPPGHAEER